MPQHACPSAEAPAGGARPERRAAPRHRSERDGTCRGVAAGWEDAWGATVRDVGPDGLGLQSRRWFPAGAQLVLGLAGTAGRAPRLLLLRVRRAAARGDGTWHLGCQLLVGLGRDGVRELRQGG